MERPELLLLGEISGKLDGVSKQLTSQEQRLDEIDARMRAVEQKAAVTGAVSGGAMSVGVTLLVEGMRQWLQGGGGLR